MLICVTYATVAEANGILIAQLLKTSKLQLTNEYSAVAADTLSPGLS